MLSFFRLANTTFSPSRLPFSNPTFPFPGQTDLQPSGLLQALLDSDLTNGNSGPSLSETLNSPLCNKECLSLCLSHFPTRAAVSKCGCDGASLGSEQWSSPGSSSSEATLGSSHDEKFLLGTEQSQKLKSIEDVSKEQYERELRRIDYELLQRDLNQIQETETLLIGSNPLPRSNEPYLLSE